MWCVMVFVGRDGGTVQGATTSPSVAVAAAVLFLLWVKSTTPHLPSKQQPPQFSPSPLLPPVAL